MTLGDRILIPGIFHLMASRKACYWIHAGGSLFWQGAQSLR